MAHDDRRQYGLDDQREEGVEAVAVLADVLRHLRTETRAILETVSMESCNYILAEWVPRLESRLKVMRLRGKENNSVCEIGAEEPRCSFLSFLINRC